MEASQRQKREIDDTSFRSGCAEEEKEIEQYLLIEHIVQLAKTNAMPCKKWVGMSQNR